MIITMNKDIVVDDKHLFSMGSDIGKLLKIHKNPEKVIWQTIFFKDAMRNYELLYDIVSSEVCL